MLIQKEPQQKQKIKIINDAADFFKDQPVGLEIGIKVFSYANKINNDELIAKASLILAAEYMYQQLYDSSGKYCDVGLARYKKLNISSEIFYAVSLKSLQLLNTNNVKEAFEQNKKLITIAERNKDQNQLAQAYQKMGILFMNTGDIEKSISYLNKALKLFKLQDNLKGIESCYLNLGVNSSSKHLNDFAIEYFERGLEVNKVTRNLKIRILFLGGIASVYYNLSNYERALQFYKEALGLAKETSSLEHVIHTTNNIGTVLMELDRFTEAKPYLIEVYYTTRNQKQYLQLTLYSSFNLAQLYVNTGDYKSAMEYMNIYVNMNDSLTDANRIKSLLEIDAKYQNEKKEEQNILLNERLKNKSLQIYFALAGIALLSILAFFIFNGLKEKQKANLELEDKNKIIEEKSIIVAEQHKDITDSIKYAERIQSAILPPEKLWKSILPNSFVFYQPKDILSGDFYWIEENEHFVFIAAADCTGHGVPGALMSIVNYNLLNKAVLEKGLTTAGEILDGINSWLTQSLHQSYQASAMRDGMDLSLCVINKQTNELNFSGAYNSIYLFSNNVLEEFVPDKQPVGAFIEDNIKPFSNKYYQLKKDDVIYMFTDGFADQFGGERGKKYKYKQLQGLLHQIKDKVFDEQKIMLSESVNKWKGNLEQVDDILLLGFKWM